MASPTTPMHGKLGSLYALRPNGFSGIGLNDLTWGTAGTNAATAYYEVVIDHIGAEDTYKWRKNGGAWTEDVTYAEGVAETLDEGQTFIFAAHTGHTVGDQWMIGNYKVEPTTVNGSVAQITTTTERLMNPNYPPVFTPTNAVTLVSMNFTEGSATFSGAPGVTTVTGNNGLIMAAQLRKVAYMIDWNLNVTLDMADASRMGQQWKEALPGQAGATGAANAYFIATEAMLYDLQATIASGEKYFLLQLFNYDPDQDQTGDHINAWVTFNSFAVTADIGSVVKEALNFQVYGGMSFVSNV